MWQMSEWLHNMRSHKSYLLLIIIPYLLLICVFHIQLQFYDKNDSTQNEELDQYQNEVLSNKRLISYDVNDTRMKFADKFHFRDLRLESVHTDSIRSQIRPSVSVNHTVMPQRHTYEHLLDDRLLLPVKEFKHSENIVLSKPATNLAGLPQLMKKLSVLSNISTEPKSSARMNLSVLINRISQDSGKQTNIPPVPLKQDKYVQMSHSNLLKLAPDLEESIQQELKREPLSGQNVSHSEFPLSEECQKHFESNENFHIYKTRQFQMLSKSYFYTAYLDDRSPGQPLVRVIALLKKNNFPQFYCHFPAARTGSSRKVTAGSPQGGVNGSLFYTVKAHYYEMCENHNKNYGGWILSCEVPLAIQSPCEVIVSRYDMYQATPSRNGNVHIPVFTLDPTPGRPKEDYGVCVPPLFGHIPSTTLIEFIELTHLLGANHLVFYMYQVTKPMREVLHYYGNRGLITVIPWELPVPEKTMWYYGQLLAINDCLYRNIHRFHYLAFNDIDEFIVPRQYAHWSGMMTSIHNFTQWHPMSHAGYTFQSSFFDPLVNGNSQILYDLESDLRTKHFSKVRSKVMVIPERIFELGIHHISRPLVDAYNTIDIDPGVGFVHHYRKCVTDFDPQMNCQVFARDESLSRHIPLLRHNVHKTLWILKELEKTTQKEDYIQTL